MYYTLGNHIDLLPYAPYFFLVSIIVFLLAGWLFGRYRLRSSSTVIVRDSLATAIFGLTALVLGFSFSSANEHFDNRIQLLRKQAASVRQVYESTKYLNPTDRATTQAALIRLVDIRMAAFQNIKKMDDLSDNLDKLSDQLAKTNEAVTLAINRSPATTKLLADQILKPQLSNLVSDIGDGILNAKRHPPAIIDHYLLLLLSVAALLTGYAMAAKKEEDWFLTALYMCVMGFTLYVIFSLEYPNLFFPTEQFNQDFIRFKDSLH